MATAVWLLALALPALAQGQGPAAGDARRIEVVVLDAQGLPVLGARVSATDAAANMSRNGSSTSERFVLDRLAPGVYTLRVSAAGFQSQERSIDLQTETEQSLEIRLNPAGITEQLVVTPSRTEQRVADVPASVNIVSNEQIERSPAVVADDVLRQVPTFSLFRRTSSLVANPTAQGVSLRGIGPSGVSRTLVLLDDIPFNDPFGGWVYWTRVPMMNAERIEIIDGATSSLYGNYAMGGVINIVTNRPSPGTLLFKPQYGNHSTPKMDVFATDVWGKFGVTLDASTLDTNGYITVAEQERGPIDNEANVEYQNVSGKVDYTASDRLNVFARFGVFDEDRNNGKIGEVNDTNWKFGNGGVRMRLRDGSNIDGRVFYDHSDFFQNTYAVPAATPPRSQSNLTLEKTVPTRALGYMAQWQKPYQMRGRTHVVSAGTDYRWIDGDSDELTYTLPTGLVPQVHRVAGGTQRFVGVFAQDLVELTPQLQLTVSARFDSWRNFDAHNHETVIATGAPTAANRPTLPDKSDDAVSPRIAALYRANERISFWGSFSKGFRAPTLKELYSPFRVGNVLTQANETLGPERLTGEELGVSIAPTTSLTVRGTWFNNRVNDAITNATISVTPALTTRQLQNVASTNISGFQTDLSYRFDQHLSATVGYVFDIAKVHEAQTDAQGNNLTGKYLAQVPKHRTGLQLIYTHPRYATIAVETQIVSHQYDDDLNQSKILPGTPDEEVGLPLFSVTNLTISRQFTKRVDGFFGVQNVFNTTYYVGTNPTTIGTPQLVNGGIRIKVGN